MNVVRTSRKRKRGDLRSGRTGAIRHSDEALREEPGPECAEEARRGEKAEMREQSPSQRTAEKQGSGWSTGRSGEHFWGIHELERSPATEREKTAVWE